MTTIKNGIYIKIGIQAININIKFKLVVSKFIIRVRSNKVVEIGRKMITNIPVLIAVFHIPSLEYFLVLSSPPLKASINDRQVINIKLKLIATKEYINV